MSFLLHRFSVLCFLLCTALLGMSQNGFTRSEYLHGTLSAQRSSFDVIHQDITVKVIPAHKFISVTNKISFTALTDIKSIQLDLFAVMLIDSIVFEGKLLTYQRDSNAFFVSFPKTLKAGNVYTIAVAAQGNPPEAKKAPWDGGFVWSKDDDQTDWVGLACEGIGASCWLPCKDHWSDEADSVDIHLIVPSHLMGVSNGRYLGYRDVDNMFTEYNWAVRNKINNYNISINVANYAHISDTFNHKTAINQPPLAIDYFVLQKNIEKAGIHFKQTHKMLEAFEYYFGPYPFIIDGYKLVETPYWGMEHQSCVGYGNDYENNDWGFDFIIVHESGHEWFGNNITAKDPAHMWIHEGFTTYSEALYVEYWQNKDKALEYLNSQHSKIVSDSPLIGPENVHFHARTNNDIYYKGSWILHTLRNVVDNDTLWFNALKEYSTTFSQQTISTGDVVTFFSKRLNMDLQPFFQQYLQEASLPVLEYRIEKKSDGRLVMRYRWKNAVKNFDMPIKVTVTKGKFETITPQRRWQLIDLNFFDENDFSIWPGRYLLKVEKAIVTTP